MCFFQVPPCDLGQSQYNLRIFYYNLRISYYDLRISPVSFLSECAFMRFLLDCGKSSDCGKSMKSLINQVYNIMHFLYPQACLIRENAKNGNF